MWNQTVNATWFNTRNFSLQITIIHKETIIQTTAYSEQSQKFIMIQQLQKNTDASNTGLHQNKIALHRPNINSVCFQYPYTHINPMCNTHEDTHRIDTQ